MKTKKINSKKLTLNKVTISKLNDDQMAEINGGITTTVVSALGMSALTLAFSAGIAQWMQK